MTNKQAVSVEEYLHSAYQPDREYLDGEIQERNLGEKDHSKLQCRLILALAATGLHVWPEQRVQVKPKRFRVPDVCVTLSEPEEQIFTEPPYIVIEVLSPDDTVRHLLDRGRDYEEFGVRNIWVIDPGRRLAYVASNGALNPAQVLLTEGGPEITLELPRLFE
jgi:Uma2 family endonuclease